MIESAAPPPQLPLRVRIVRGLGWKIASETWSQVFGIAVAILLARLLTPHDYGVAAMVIVFSPLWRNKRRIVGVMSSSLSDAGLML